MIRTTGKLNKRVAGNWGKKKMRRGDEEKRKNNIVIFLFREQREESYFETLDTAVKWLRETMKEELTNENIEYVE
jgi:hypothetical protein